MTIVGRKSEIRELERYYDSGPFEINKDYAQQLERKKTVFVQETGTRSAIHITMITTYGLSKKDTLG